MDETHLIKKVWDMWLVKHNFKNRDNAVLFTSGIFFIITLISIFFSKGVLRDVFIGLCLLAAINELRVFFWVLPNDIYQKEIFKMSPVYELSLTQEQQSNRFISIEPYYISIKKNGVKMVVESCSIKIRSWLFKGFHINSVSLVINEPDIFRTLDFSTSKNNGHTQVMGLTAGARYYSGIFLFPSKDISIGLKPLNTPIYIKGQARLQTDVFGEIPVDFESSAILCESVDNGSDKL